MAAPSFNVKDWEKVEKEKKLLFLRPLELDFKFYCLKSESER